MPAGPAEPWTNQRRSGSIVQREAVLEDGEAGVDYVGI
jgi:hypothetical protein